MVERLRALLEHPLDPRLARAVVVLACGVTLGFAVMVLLVGPAAERPAAGPAASSRPPAAAAPSPVAPPPPRAAGARVRQDPQDRLGSAAQRRAAREIAGHRALQHIPYRAGGFAVELVGARGDRAVLAVRAATLTAAHRGWRVFLRRYRDDGRSYLPRFQATGGPRG